MLLVNLVVAACALAPATQSEFEARVDGRVELLTTVFRLIGADEFNMPNSASEYSRRVDKYFLPYKNHSAVKMAAMLREKRGIGFDAVPTLAVNLTNVHDLAERIPFNPAPKRWDKRWDPEEARAFVKELKKFVKDTKFEDFLNSEKPYFAKATTGLTKLLTGSSVSTWLNSLYGTKPGRSPFVIVGMLCGGGNYGMSVEFPDGSIEMSPVFGASDFNKDGVPQFSDNSLPLIIHEFSHGYVNPIVRKHLNRLMPAATKLLNLNRNILAANAYGQEDAVLYETFVRTAETYLTQEHMNPRLGFASLINQRSTGFLWTSDLIDVLREELAGGKRTFEECMPAMVDELVQLSKSPEALLKRCPKATAFDVTWGEMDGDMRLMTVKAAFDQPMMTDRRGFSMEPDGWSVVKPTVFGADARSIELTLKVKPGVDYKASLNRFGRGLTSASGYPVMPFGRVFKSPANLTSLAGARKTQDSASRSSSSTRLTASIRTRIVG